MTLFHCLRTILPSIISLEESAFVGGQDLMGNVMLA